MSLDRFRPQRQKPDYLLLIVIFILILFGFLMIYSSSVVESFEKYGYNHYYLLKQFKAFLLGIVFWFIFSQINYRVWKKYAASLLLLTLIILIAVFIPGLGREAGGANRWIDIGPLAFQPTEISKLTFIIYLSAWLVKKGEGIGDFQQGVLPFIIIVSVIAFLIIKQPDMGTMSIITGIVAILFITAGAHWQYIFMGGLAAMGIFMLLIKSAPYRLQRLMVFLNPSSENLGASYHINQAFLAIGSGGLFGLGFGQSKQKFFYLPEAHTDSIFAIIAEELGFFRASLVILAFVLIAWRGLKIAKNAPDEFARLLATGITFWIIAQALINIAAITGLLPLTGIPMPFVSYGGTSLVILLAGVGILTNISKQANSNQ